MSSDEFLHRQILATNVRVLRAHRRWTQETLSFESGIDRTLIAQVEAGKRNVSIDSLSHLARAFEIPFYELFKPR